MGRPVLFVARTEDYGPAFKDLRMAHEVSQADLGEAMGMHPSHVGSYERGTVIPRGDQLLRMLAAHNYVVALVPRELMTDGFG